MVACEDTKASTFKSPGTTVQDCFQGGAQADCAGYESTCDCTYESGGCYITKPAKAGMACKCTYAFLHTCEALPVPCKNIADSLCKEPDDSFLACAYGGGDCGAYGLDEGQVCTSTHDDECTGPLSCAQGKSGEYHCCASAHSHINGYQ